MKEYNKLVRDRIPEIIAAKGGESETHIATDEEYRQKAIEKLQEELAEFLESKDPEELADLLEITYAVAESLGVSKDELEAMRLKKANERGGFAKRVILERS
ncbi:MAG: nucleoside triphosphate pyrophosphohydrolase [Patescibacteria group bacterium]